jgi:hypothetical protein
LFQQIIEGRHAVPHRFMARRHVHRAADIYLAGAIAGEVRCPQKAGCCARSEHFAIPVTVVIIADGAGIIALKYFAYAFANRLIGLPVPACGQGIAVLAVILVFIRIPLATADPLDQPGTDAVAFSEICSAPGRAARVSNIDVPWGSFVILLRALGERTSNWRGTVMLPVCSNIDCSGERLQLVPKRACK